MTAMVMPALAAAGASLAALLWAGSAVDRRATALRLPAVESAGGLEARLAEGLSVRRPAADRAWIDLLIYTGGDEFVLDRGGQLGELAHRAADFDPSFREVYLFGGSMLMWQCDRPEEAARLLRRGIERNPADPKLKMYLAAFTYSRLKDLGSEIEALEPLAFEPGAPIILKRILANAWEARARSLRGEAERRQALMRAVAIWRHVWLTSDSPEERRWVAVKCGKLGLDPHRFERPEK